MFSLKFYYILALGILGSQCLSNPSNIRIVGGRTALEGQFPYIVSLRHPGNRHICGGSIVNQHWILTAAHCIYMNKSPLTVVVGTNHLSYGGYAYPAVKYLYHRDFNFDDILNDIALIKVGIPIQFNERIQPVSLATFNVPSGYNAIVSGWGKLGEYSPLSDNLLYQVFQTIDFPTCSSLLLPSKISYSQICAFSTYGQGTCQGDSGSPLVINGVQHGITSWGIACAVGVPDVYTRVYSHLSWVYKTMMIQ